MNHFNKLIEAFRYVWPATPPVQGMLHNDGTKTWWVEDDNGDNIITWECRPFPGCASLIVTTKVVLRDDLRNQGLGRWFRELRHRAYARAGFQGEIATVRTDNAPQNRLMETMGATKMGVFPSDFGGSYALWLTKLTHAEARPNAAPVQTPEPRVEPPAHPTTLGNVWVGTTRPTLPPTPKKKFSHRP